jgi:hypothetical protein
VAEAFHHRQRLCILQSEYPDKCIAVLHILHDKAVVKASREVDVRGEDLSLVQTFHSFDVSVLDSRRLVTPVPQVLFRLFPDTSMQ